MALKLTHEFRLPGHVIDHGSVADHLGGVLRSFAAKSDCTKFYVGITGNLDQRRKEHERDKREYTLMCVIYGEPVSVVGESFHNLETIAIERFQGGVLNEATGRRLQCTNGQGGSSAKSWLYLLVDKQDVSGIRLYKPGSVWVGE